jgi:hypothetical protein
MSLFNSKSGIGAYTDGISEKIAMLRHQLEQGELKYMDVERAALGFGLTLAEFGDGADYSVATDYAYWNVSGKRTDPAAIYVEYDFDILDESGRENRAGTVHFVDINPQLVGMEVFEALNNGDELTSHGFVQACRLVGLKINDTVLRSIACRVHSFRTVDGRVIFRVYKPKIKMSQAVWNLGEQLVKAVGSSGKDIAA